MRLYTFLHKAEPRIGAEHDGQLIDLNFAHSSRMGEQDASLGRTMIELIEGGEHILEEAHNALRYAAENPELSAKWSHNLADVELLAPIPRPGKILCCGLNYRSHVQENPNARFLEDPRFFVKTPNTVIGPNAPIRWPGEKFQVDYEVELAVVIGRKTRQVTATDALSHVFGYTILHDVSSRWIQFKDNNEDMGKNFDSFAPMGPCIVTADEIPDPSTLSLKTRLNGRVMQDGTNREWCFSLPRLLEWYSSGMTLEPGDVVTTGTPSGIGFFRDPQVFLKPGDVCELEISQIGVLRNPVVADLIETER